MKVTIGTYVEGECGAGKVIAMTEQWCIYKDPKMKPGDDEVAEPWNSIVIPLEAAETVSSVQEKEL